VQDFGGHLDCFPHPGMNFQIFDQIGQKGCLEDYSKTYRRIWLKFQGMSDLARCAVAYILEANVAATLQVQETRNPS